MSYDTEFQGWAENEISELRSGTTLRRPSPNQSVFKYVGLNTKTSWEYLERTLNHFDLVGATPSSLNDPFEVSPCIFDDLRPSVIASSLRFSGLNNRLDGKPDSPEEVFADVGKYRDLAHSFLQRTSRYSRIVSMCERSDSPLLWSHYANSYQGACLHFLGSAFQHSKGRVGYVKYQTHRPIYPLSLALALSDRPYATSYGTRLGVESDRLMFFVKAEHWNYEDEIRIVYNSNSVPNITFRGDALASVIIGPRMSEENRQRIRNLVSKSPLAHLPVREAKLSGNSFSVEID